MLLSGCSSCLAGHSVLPPKHSSCVSTQDTWKIQPSVPVPCCQPVTFSVLSHLKLPLQDHFWIITLQTGQAQGKNRHGSETVEANFLSRSKPSPLLGLWVMGHLGGYVGGIAGGWRAIKGIIAGTMVFHGGCKVYSKNFSWSVALQDTLCFYLCSMTLALRLAHNQTQLWEVLRMFYMNVPAEDLWLF